MCGGCFLGKTCGLAEVDSDSLVPANTSSSICSEKSRCGEEVVENEREEVDWSVCGDYGDSDSHVRKRMI